MNKSGTYKIIDGELVKVSDNIPSLKPSVWFPKASGHSGYYSENLDSHIMSRDHKRRILKEKGAAEV